MKERGIEKPLEQCLKEISGMASEKLRKKLFSIPKMPGPRKEHEHLVFNLFLLHREHQVPFGHINELYSRVTKKEFKELIGNCMKASNPLDYFDSIYLFRVRPKKRF